MSLKTEPSGPVFSSDINGRFQQLLTLVALFKNARHKSRESELEFLMVNQTYNLIPYRHCVYWQGNGGNVFIKAVSGLVQVDPHGPYTLWLKRVLEKFIKDKLPGKTDHKGSVLLLPLSPSDCSKEDAVEWKSWLSINALLLVMRNDHGQVVGGLLMDRDDPFNDLEKAFAEDLSDGYAFILRQFEKTSSSHKIQYRWLRMFKASRRKMRYALVALIAILLIPVRLSATVPAEIVASKPSVITVPFDGILKDIEVSPGQVVKKGDLLVRMDRTMLQNKSDMADSEKEIANLAYRKTEREGLADPSKLAELAILKSQLEQKTSEKKFAGELLARADIVASQDGVVIFADANALRGKPVQTGEQIMLLANPKQSELLLRVPVDSMIIIDQKIPAKFFLNVLPIGSREAVYESIGYQATHDPDGLLTYKIKARFEDADDKLRIGWTGIGKIYGDRTILAINILRRPFVSLRRKMGM